MGYDLKFIHLGITIEHLHNHISVFGFAIAFYGIIIATGMLLGMFLASSDMKRRGLNPDLIMDLALFGIVFGVIGARIYYVIFSWDSYKNHPLEILNIRGGGLAIYGGVIAAAITTFVYSRAKKVSFFTLADSAVLGLLVGQILGRWGNFFNAEAFGGYTNGPFAMQIKKSIVNPNMLNDAVLHHLVQVNGIDYIQVHPTFLYESVWNFCLLLLLLWYRKKKKFEGEMFWLYIGGYGLGRAMIEGLRTDSLLVPGTNIAVSQMLAILCVVISVITIVHKKKG